MYNKIDNTITISLPERFHNEQAEDIGWRLDETLIQHCDVILDFSHVNYIDSSGLTVLISANKAAKAKGIKLTLQGMNDEVKTFFALTCLDKVLTIK